MEPGAAGERRRPRVRSSAAESRTGSAWGTASTLGWSRRARAYSALPPAGSRRGRPPGAMVEGQRVTHDREEDDQHYRPDHGVPPARRAPAPPGRRPVQAIKRVGHSHPRPPRWSARRARRAASAAPSVPPHRACPGDTGRVRGVSRARGVRGASATPAVLAAPGASARPGLSAGPAGLRGTRRISDLGGGSRTSETSGTRQPAPRGGRASERAGRLGRAGRAGRRAGRAGARRGRIERRAGRSG